MSDWSEVNCPEHELTAIKVRFKALLCYLFEREREMKNVNEELRMALLVVDDLKVRLNSNYREMNDLKRRIDVALSKVVCAFVSGFFVGWLLKIFNK